MIEEYVPSGYQNDNFYERFMEQRTRDLNNPSTTEEHDSFPFPIEPLRSMSSINQPKRSSMHSNDSRITSPLASSCTPVLLPTIPAETSTPQPSSSQAAQPSHVPPREPLSPIQQFVRNSATPIARSSVKPRPKGPQYNRAQPDYPDSQSVLKTITRQGYKLWIPFILLPQFYNFCITRTIAFYLKLLFYLIASYDEQDSYDPATSIDWTSWRPKDLLKPDSVLILIPTNFLPKDCKKPRIFLFVVQFQRRKSHSILQYKGRRGLKGPRRPTEPGDLL